MSFQFPKTSAELGPLLKKYNLVLTSGWYDGRILERDIDAEWAAILPHMTLLKDLGCTHVVYADTSRRAEGDLFAPISRRPKLSEDEWTGYGKRLTGLAERMAEFGVGMAFHHHMGTIIETDAEVDRLMAVTGPAVGLLYDTGHSVFSGGDPVALLERNVKRVVHVHCKDARKDLLEKARATDESFMQAVLDGVFTVPGDGFIDYPTILKILHDAGYSGWLVCEAEQDPGKAHPLTYARLGFSNLVRMALQAGFTVSP
jgi:inosose dehydratase